MDVFDSSEATFAKDVVEASRDVPVLVDFWAEWCGPCKQLGPLLERLATESGGAWRLAKVDTEREQRLAAMFQVQSIPFVVAFKGGRPVDAFVGVLDEPKVLDFLAKLGVDQKVQPDVIDAEIVTPFSEVTDALRARDVTDLGALQAKLAGIEEDDDDYTRAQRLADAGAWFAGELEPAGPAADLAGKARALWLEGYEREAMETLLESLAADSAWAGELARKAVVALMQLHDEDSAFVDGLRRRLAVLLY